MTKTGKWVGKLLKNFAVSAFNNSLLRVLRNYSTPCDCKYSS